MSTLKLHKIRFQNGLWEGLLEAPDATDAPAVQVLHLDRPLTEVNLAPEPEGNQWSLSFKVPNSALTDGVQSFLICDQSSNETLGELTLIAGDAVADDLRAEVELLRAELDMLKGAFRRHCCDTQHDG